MKKIVAACLILFMALGLVTVSASAPGSVGDPLISRTHLRGAYSDALIADIRLLFEGATDLALSRVNDLYMEASGYSFAPRFSQVTINAGQALALGPGASFILNSGTASFNTIRGTVINISNGQAVTSGLSLTTNNRFFTTENTHAIILASSTVTGYVDGFFNFDGVVATPERPVDSNRPPIIDEIILPPTGPLPFTDVSSGDWFRGAVDFVYRNGLFAGTTGTTFSPNAPMTRGMFVTVLHRLEGRPNMGASVGFSDVTDSSAFFYDAVAWASTHQIVTGFADGTFRPNVAITREQMATIMFRYAEHTGRSLVASEGALNPFPDRGRVSAFAAESMAWAVSWNVIRGGTGGNLLPTDTATRAHVAQIILNYVTHVGS